MPIIVLRDEGRGSRGADGAEGAGLGVRDAAGFDLGPIGGSMRPLDVAGHGEAPVLAKLPPTFSYDCNTIVL